MIFKIIGWIVFGLIVGSLAKFLIPGSDSASWINSILLGIAGSFVGGFLGNLLFGKNNEKSATYGGFVFSLIGAVILQLLFRQFVR
jgi:uncharacterized membrane protein YeaQ/YmgE (transglycosylase-associated protein family)